MTQNFRKQRTVRALATTLNKLGRVALMLGLAPLGSGCGAEAPTELGTGEEVGTTWQPINEPACLNASVDGMVTLNDGISVSAQSLTTPATYHNPRCNKAYVFGLQGYGFAPGSLLLPTNLRNASVKLEWVSVPRNITRQQCQAMNMTVEVMTSDPGGNEPWQKTQVISFPARWSAVGCAVEGVEISSAGFKSLMDRYDANGNHLWSESGVEPPTPFQADLSNRGVKFAVSARLWTDETVPVKITGIRTFNPATHGFKFPNRFRTEVFGGFLFFDDIKTKGLCGGMVYSALDYYLGRKPIPVQDFPPTTNQALRGQIYERQKRSISSPDNLSKWYELYQGPGSADMEDLFFRGIKAKDNVRQLRDKLDKGQPVVLQMRDFDGAFGHQVLALGYSLGFYQQSDQTYPELELDVYDPNFPNEVTKIKRDPENLAMMDVTPGDEHQGRRWKAYFVDNEYEKRTTLAIPAPGNGLTLTFHTRDQESDDALDDGDIVNIDVTLKNRTTQSFPKVNGGQAWARDSLETVFLPVSPADVARVVINYAPQKPLPLFAWNKWSMQSLVVRNVVNSVTVSDRTTVEYHRFNKDEPNKRCSVELGSRPTTKCPEDDQG